MDVICEIMRLKTDRVQEYMEMHEKPWPGLVSVIRDSGFIEEYIYLFDTLVIVVMKCKDFKASRKKLVKHEVFQKWTKKVQDMLEEDKKTFPIGGKLVDLKPVWKLSDY